MIVLASTSAIRQHLLRQAGIPYEALKPHLDEDALKAERPDLQPEELARVLAEHKAIAGNQQQPQGMIIGADQILSCGNRMFDKPRSIDQARQHLLYLRNKTHRLTSAVACAVNGRVMWHHTESAELTMRDFSDAFLDTYLASGGTDLLSSVGAYKLEGSGITLFTDIRGDYFTILGLPLLPLMAFLRASGAIPS